MCSQEHPSLVRGTMCSQKHPSLVRRTTCSQEHPSLVRSTPRWSGAPLTGQEHHVLSGAPLTGQEHPSLVRSTPHWTLCTLKRNTLPSTEPTLYVLKQKHCPWVDTPHVHVGRTRPPAFHRDCAQKHLVSGRLTPKARHLGSACPEKRAGGVLTPLPASAPPPAACVASTHLCAPLCVLRGCGSEPSRQRRLFSPGVHTRVPRLGCPAGPPQPAASPSTLRSPRPDGPHLVRVRAPRWGLGMRAPRRAWRVRAGRSRGAGLGPAAPHTCPPPLPTCAPGHLATWPQLIRPRCASAGAAATVRHGAGRARVRGAAGRRSVARPGETVELPGPSGGGHDAGRQEKLLQRPDTPTQGAAGKGRSSEARAVPVGADAGADSQHPKSGPRQCLSPGRVTALDPAGPQSQGAGRALQARGSKPGKQPLSPAPGQKKLLKAGVPGTTVPPQSSPSGPAHHHPVPCGLGGGPCHLANLLSTLAQDNPDSGPKKGPPEVACQVRKKTRTLYRSDQLEELERAFGEDHYPDSDKRQEIAQTVGVAAQRIMVWFQNRRAKWRRVEKLNGKGVNETPNAPTPAAGHSSDTAAEPPPAVSVGTGPGAPSQGCPPSAPPESSMHLEPPRPPDPAQEGGDTHQRAVTPPLFSPPPVRRADPPFPLRPVHTPQLMPLLLDGPGSDTGLREGPCVSWTTSITPPPSCPYLEELDPQGHQRGAFPFPPAPQPPLSQPPQPLFPYLHPFASPSSLTPPALDDALFPGPYSVHGGPSQSFFLGPPTGQGLLQPPAGSTGQVPWSHPYLPELPLPGSFCAQALSQPSGAEGYFPDDLFLAPYDPAMGGQHSLNPTALPSGPRPSGAESQFNKATEGPLAAPQSQQNRSSEVLTWSKPASSNSTQQPQGRETGLNAWPPKLLPVGRGLLIPIAASAHLDPHHLPEVSGAVILLGADGFIFLLRIRTADQKLNM
ncbi:PREDICTED: homeobox protein NOBOX [Elephantulus edwardii]|uniref:homeobox protein NOBOX n=1 Tax=Elephantulus edwardii TaxID=28737 RepID=UPI0003F07CD7|nr:PREDICTED: homeobox protein NOBOX [Elephantulus edwardii]